MIAGFLFTMGGYLVGALVFYLAARRSRAADDRMGTVALAGLGGGVLGAKLTEWFISGGPALAAQPTVLLDPRLGGRALIGGVIAGWIAVEIAKRCLGIRRSTGDFFALALPAGEAVGRIGCFFNGCCYGVPVAGVAAGEKGPFWAVLQHNAWRHPVQLYTAVAALLILGILLAVRDRLPRQGDLFRLYLVLFGVSRFGLEFWRVRTTAFAGLSLAQWTCLELAVVGTLMLAYSMRRKAGEASPAGERSA